MALNSKLSWRSSTLEVKFSIHLAICHVQGPGADRPDQSLIILDLPSLCLGQSMMDKMANDLRLKVLGISLSSTLSPQVHVPFSWGFQFQTHISSRAARWMIQGLTPSRPDPIALHMQASKIFHGIQTCKWHKVEKSESSPCKLPRVISCDINLFFGQGVQWVCPNISTRHFGGTLQTWVNISENYHPTHFFDITGSVGHRFWPQL